MDYCEEAYYWPTDLSLFIHSCNLWPSTSSKRWPIRMVPTQRNKKTLQFLYKQKIKTCLSKASIVAFGNHYDRTSGDFWDVVFSSAFEAFIWDMTYFLWRSINIDALTVTRWNHLKDVLNLDMWIYMTSLTYIDHNTKTIANDLLHSAVRALDILPGLR